MCRKIQTSNEYDPPKLHRHHPHPSVLSGSWFSNRCETRPHGLFVTRYYGFDDSKQTFRGYYNHFADELCRQPMFTIYVTGSYHRRGVSETLTDAYEYDFHVDEAAVTPKDIRTVNNLNHDKVAGCGYTTWTVGKEQVIPTNEGCSVLGLSVPYVEYEVVKLDREHHNNLLYLGQRPSQGNSPTSPERRPTSFQPPLIRCSSHVLSKTSPNMTPESQSASSGISTSYSVILELLSLTAVGWFLLPET